MVAGMLSEYNSGLEAERVTCAGAESRSGVCWCVEIMRSSKKQQLADIYLDIIISSRQRICVDLMTDSSRRGKGIQLILITLSFPK
jgi:hypothetical protein